jgi:hypothetical protein
MTDSAIRILAIMMERKSDTDPRSMNKKYPQDMTRRENIHVLNP